MGSRRRADDLIVEALADGLPDAKAAERAGVSPKTVQRRRADPEIRGRVRALISERERERNRRLAAIWDAGEAQAGQAVLTLVNLLSSRSEIARLGAARILLERFGPTERPEEVDLPGAVEPPQYLRDIFKVEGDRDPEAVEGELIDMVRDMARADRGQLPRQEAPRLRVVEQEVDPEPVSTRRPADGLTDLERSELQRHRLYREGVPAAVQREVLRRAGLG